MFFSLHADSIIIHRFSLFYIVAGFTRYLNKVEDMDMPPTQYWYCTLSMAILYMSGLCSTLFILNMTFERFYSILKPHKAASVNTVKRAKITILCVVLFSVTFSIPHCFITTQSEKECVPFGKARSSIIGQFYHWFSMGLNFAVPFVLLLSMNCFIIHKLQNRPDLSNTTSSRSSQGHEEGQVSKVKSSEMQMYVILLLVTFGFLTLTTPAYALFIYMMFYNYEKSANAFAGFSLFYSVSQKTYYTNYAINFFFYVISGKKFRSDLNNLFKLNPKNKPKFHSHSSAKDKS